jgi:hypothetical protein
MEASHLASSASGSRSSQSDVDEKAFSGSRERKKQVPECTAKTNRHLYVVQMLLYLTRAVSVRAHVLCLLLLLPVETPAGRPN